jgi:nucleoside 2-deoxyribosyltransferase
MMSIKVYLAGGFFRDLRNEERANWRYPLAKGLDRETPIIDDGKGGKWGILPNAIFDCIDYIGPYPDVQQTVMEVFRIRDAIKEADMVFAWIDDLLPSEVSKVSCELAYASALGKLTGIGASDASNELLNDIWVAHAFSSLMDVYHIADSPKESLMDCFRFLLHSIDLEKQISFYKRNHQSKKLCSDRLNRCGYVCLIKADTGHYKIGRTNSIPNRMKLFAVKLPFDFEIIHTFPAEDATEAEEELHNLFNEKRVRGEWFNLDKADIDHVKSICRQQHSCFYDKDNEWIMTTDITDEEFAQLING